MKPEYEEKIKLCYMDKAIFIVYIKTENIFGDIAKDVETRFDTLNYELEGPLPKGKNLKSNWITKRCIRRENVLH